MQADNIQKLTAAANVKVEPYWPGLFAKLFANKSMDDLITNVGAGKHSAYPQCYTVSTAVITSSGQTDCIETSLDRHIMLL